MQIYSLGEQTLPCKHLLQISARGSGGGDSLINIEDKLVVSLQLPTHRRGGGGGPRDAEGDGDDGDLDLHHLHLEPAAPEHVEPCQESVVC